QRLDQQPALGAGGEPALSVLLRLLLGRGLPDRPRYLDLKGDLLILESLRVLQDVPNTPAVRGRSVPGFDRSANRNQFTGLQLGTDMEFRKGPCFLGLRLKVALGDVHEVVTINGAQTITPPGGGTTLFRGGLLALPSNIGRFSQDRFAVLPEL